MNFVKDVPKISVVLTVFNGEKYIFDCISSVLKQNFIDFELLIGEDCSSDNSRKIIQCFSDKRIRCFFRERNVGLFHNLNELVKVARAPLIRILCQDDILESSCLEEEFIFFNRYPEVDMSFCKATLIDEKGRETEKWMLNDLPEVVPFSLSIQLFYYYGCIPGNLSTVCIRGKSFDFSGLFDESFMVAGDYEMWVRICKSGNLGVIHKHLVKIRSHPNRLSSASDSAIEFIRENRKIRSILFPLLPKEIQLYAKKYTEVRQNVSDTNFIINCFFRGRLKYFYNTLVIIGLREFASGLWHWIISLNGHFFQTKPKFVE